MKTRILIFLTIVIALLNVAVLGPKKVSQRVDLSSIVKINSANAELPTWNDCSGVIISQQYIYYDGDDAAIAYTYECQGNSGPCCEGLLIAWYVVIPGSKTPSNFEQDYRVHTSC